jgi:hypothetical protein
MDVRFCDEFDGSFGWVVDEFMERCSHALVVDGRIWLIDPVDGDGVEERVRAAGQPAGVIQLLGRHQRDSTALAERLGVRRHVVPRGAVGPFSFIPIGPTRLWREVALWWPERRVLVAGDALGTAAYFRALHERLAVHPLLRLVPPRRQLGGLEPEIILCGHGNGVLGDADEALRQALSSARGRIPAQIASAVRAYRARRPS